MNGDAKILPYDSTTSSPASEIISFARQISAHLIVVGATGSSCKEYCNLGSTAASIAINSPISVLIVR
jgi:nucleotide-binding universal stress UspA family protein